MINDLTAILSGGESYTTEFKKNPDKTLVEEVCAFANASGGKVFIGVDNDGKILKTDVGNTHVLAYRTQLMRLNRILTWILPCKTRFSLLLFPRVRISLIVVLTDSSCVRVRIRKS